MPARQRTKNCSTPLPRYTNHTTPMNPLRPALNRFYLTFFLLICFASAAYYFKLIPKIQFFLFGYPDSWPEKIDPSNKYTPFCHFNGLSFCWNSTSEETVMKHTSDTPGCESNFFFTRKNANTHGYGVYFEGGPAC